MMFNGLNNVNRVKVRMVGAREGKSTVGKVGRQGTGQNHEILILLSGGDGSIISTIIEN